MGGRVGWLKEAWMGKHLFNRRCFLVFLLMALSLFFIPSVSADNFYNGTDVTIDEGSYNYSESFTLRDGMVIESDFRTDDDGFGARSAYYFMRLYQDDNNYVMMGYDDIEGDGNHYSIREVEAGFETDQYITDVSWDYQNYHTHKMTFNGSHFLYYIDGIYKGAITTDFSAGDNFKVQAYEGGVGDLDIHYVYGDNCEEVNITAKDELTNERIAPITVTYNGGAESKSGDYVYLNYTNLTSQEITVSSSNYEQRPYLIRDNICYGNISAYLLDLTNSTDITFTVYAGDNKVGNATVTVEKQINGSYEIVGEGLTDDNGRISFPLVWLDTYKVTASKGGYDDVVKTIEINAYSFDLYLSEPTERGEYYVTHHVTFKLITPMGQPLSGVNVTAIGHSDESTFGSLEWLANLLGIDYIGTELHNTTMNGTTDETGSITFLMVEEMYYSVHFNDSSRNINLTKYYYPREDYYTIIIKEEEEVSMVEALNISVTKSKINATHAYINLTYNDSTALTNYVNTTIYKKADFNEWSSVANHSTTSSDFNHSFIVEDYKGYSYLIEVNISHSLFGDLKRDFATQFKGKLLDLGLPDSVYPWLSFGLLMFLGLLFGRTSVNQGALICCFSGWMFLWFGWLDIVGGSATIALTLATILAITGVINEWQKKEGVR